MEELSATLDYLLSIPRWTLLSQLSPAPRRRHSNPPALSDSEKCKARGFTVIVDGRKSQWNTVKTVVLMLQV